jgi:hypothetical protein
VVIIRRQKKDLLFITQADHAALAAHIVSHWCADGFPTNPRRDVILLATREHDNGWFEEDETTLVDPSGEPLDFVAAPIPVKHRIWPRAAARLAKSSPYAGALVARHALTVHGQQRADPVWRGFLDRMARIEADLLKAAVQGDSPLNDGREEDQREQGEQGDQGDSPLNDRPKGTVPLETVPLETVPLDYRFVQAGDQLSLVFCNAWTAAFPRPGGRTILKGTTLEIAPDPFEGARIPLRVPARRIVARRFASAADLRAAFDAAPLEMLEGEAAGTATV